MKQRIITGILIGIVATPFFVFGGHFMAFFILMLSILSTIEILNVKKKANLNKIPTYIYVLSIIFSLLMIFDIYPISEYGYDFIDMTIEKFGINILWIIVSCFTLLSCSVFDKKYSIIDAIYTFGTTLLLSLGFKGMLFLREINIDKNIIDGALIIAYVLITACFTDIFAYFGGMTCYKLLGSDKVHKLNERISPKKTIEGSIIGTLFGSVCGFIFALLLVNSFSNIKWYVLLLMTLCLSLSSQIGDLIFSAIKRHFNIKDYSNLLPGHGGILDRLDSILINCMIAALILSFIL